MSGHESEWTTFRIQATATFGATPEFVAQIDRPNGDLLHVEQRAEELPDGKTGKWVYVGPVEGEG